jgi:hypothetical protein
MAGMAMQFGSAAEIFYFLAIAVFGVYLFFKDKKNFPDAKTIVLSCAALGLTFAPQVLFDLRHEGILRGTISRFLYQEESFKAPFKEVIKIRFPLYYDVFFSKLFRSEGYPKALSALVFGLLAVLNRKKILKDRRVVLILVLIAAPVIGMLFFQGNYGNVYDYYFTGYYLIFVVLFSVVLGFSSKTIWGKALIIVFLGVFLKHNLPEIKNYIATTVDLPTTIALGNEKQALDWIYTDAAGRDFNTDVYVPPVIPYAYDYLFKWYGGGKYGKIPNLKQLSLLYTLYEIDPPHPERLEAWLIRQATIGKVEEEKSFGGITVQRRTRYEIQD